MTLAEAMNQASETAAKAAVALENKINSDNSEIWENWLKGDALRKRQQNVELPRREVFSKCKVLFDISTSVQTITWLPEPVSTKTILDFLEPLAPGAPGGPIGAPLAGFPGYFQVMDEPQPGEFRTGPNGVRYQAVPHPSGGFASMWSKVYKEIK